MIAFYYYYIGLNSISRSALAWYVQTGGNVSDEGAPTKDQFESECIDYPPPRPWFPSLVAVVGGREKGRRAYQISATFRFHSPPLRLA